MESQRTDKIFGEVGRDPSNNRLDFGDESGSRNFLKDSILTTAIPIDSHEYKKAVLSPGNRAMPQMFF